MTDGIIVINKPKGITSNGVVQKVRKTLNTRQVGHCGTLDPLATGVLPILIGKGTKISKYLVEHDKTYIATIKLGEKKDTADGEGKTIATKEISDTNDEKIIQVLDSFIGKQMQIPPMFSAIKKDGKKLYEYARDGKTIEINPREIEIYSMRLIHYNKEENTIEYEVKCSKGTYIRTLCEDISEQLGTVGYMQELTRIKVDKFSIENTITIEELETKKDSIPYISIEDIFKDYKKIELGERELKLFLNGVMLTVKEANGVYRIYSENRFIGLGTVQNKRLKRDVII